MQENNHIQAQFKQLYDRYAPGLICFARKFVDNQTAEDMVHDVFLRLWNRSNALIIIDETIGSYLFRSVRNSCLDYLKRQAVCNDYLSRTIAEFQMEELAVTDDFMIRLIEQEQMNAIYKAIDGLPEKCRKVFVLAYLEEKKNTEIAEQFNISVRTVEAQIYKALKMLRTVLKTPR